MAILSSMFVLDSLYYGRPTLTPLNFVLTNMSPVSLFYGASPWHYYITQALPILCTTSLPFVLHGAWLSLTRYQSMQDHAHDKKYRSGNLSSKPHLVMLVCISWTILVYSIAGHKEWRFIHPLLPLLHILAATSLVRTFTSPYPSRWLPPIEMKIIAILLLSLPASLYVMFIFGSAQISVMHFLRTLNQQEVSSIGFLMPCHSTPWQAYLHNPMLGSNGRMWALGCEPPLGLS
jgi:GPI mannosyltransferase 3